MGITRPRPDGGVKTKKTGITRPRPDGGVNSPRGIRHRSFPLPLRMQNTLRSLKLRGEVV